MSIGASSLAAGFEVVKAFGGSNLTLRGISVSGVVTMIDGEKTASKYDRNKLNYGTKGASVIEFAVLDFASTSGFAGKLPKSGEMFSEDNQSKHTVGDCVNKGATFLCYCKVT